MFRDLLTSIESTVLGRSRSVLAGVAVITIISVWLGSGIELRTSRRELTPANDPVQLRWDRFREDFNGPEPMIVAVEALDDAVPVERLETIVRTAAGRLDGHPLVSRLFYRLDIDWLTEHALWLVSPEALEEGLTSAVELLADSEGRLMLGGLASVDERLARRIESSLATGSAMPGDNAEEEAARLAELMAAQRAFLETPESFVDELARAPLGILDAADRGALTPQGFLATDDQRALFLLVSLATVTEPLDKQRDLVALTRSTLEELIGGDPGITYGLTGGPAMDVEEMAALGRDGRRTTLIASVGVLLLSLVAFQRRRHAFLGLVTLAAGVAWAIGAVWLELGYLNMITTALVPILVGMGIDYAVHPLSQYELERRTLGRRDAVRATFRKTSPAVLISALTTSAAFFCFLFMEFRGFSELGLVTGVGVLLCLIAALLVLPALLTRFGDGGASGAAPIDRIWTPRTAARLCAAPAISVSIALLLTAAAGWAAWGVRLDTDLLELLPASAESLRTLETVNERSPLSAEFNLVAVDDRTELPALEARAAQEPTIRRVDSIGRFVPDAPDASAAAIARVRDVLGRTSVVDEPFDAERLTAAAHRLEVALADAADEAFVTGLGELAASLESARGDAERVAALASEIGQPDRWRRGEERLRDRMGEILDRLRAATETEAPTVSTLPEPIRQRFVTRSGRHVVYLAPRGDVYDPEFLERFNAASLRVSPEAIGFPMLFADHSAVITDGFGLAFGVGGLLVCLLLLADLRNVGHAALALVPVLVGTLWMLGLMRATGLVFNLANLVAIPIVLGVGIDAGVHVVHRFRLERVDGVIVVLEHTGRAILIASLTTMVGFGSLALAEHRGMASLGVLLFLGVGACMVAALWILPNLLLALGLAER